MRFSAVLLQVAWIGVFAAAATTFLFNGANRPLPSTILSAAIFGALCLALLAGRPERPEPAGAGRLLTAASLLAIGVIAWAALQTALAPALDPSAAWPTVMRLAAYVAAFWIAAQAFADAAAARRLIDALALFAGLAAVYALAAFAAGVNPLLDARFADRGYASGPLIYRNAFAFFAVLGLLASVAAVDRRLGASAARSPIVTFLRDLGAGWTWVFALAAAASATAVAATQSRMGLVVAALGALAYAWARPTRVGVAGAQRLKAQSWGALAGAALLAVAVALSGDATLDRIGETGGVDAGRFAAVAAALDTLAEKPWPGHGPGAFQEAVRPQLPEAVASVEWDKAHNVYLELAVELGVPAAMLWFAALAIVFVALLSGVAARSRRRDILSFAFAALVIGAAHSAVDFPLQIPAIAVFFALALGAGWANAFSSRGREAPPVNERSDPPRSRRRRP